jgi:Catalase
MIVVHGQALNSAISSIVAICHLQSFFDKMLVTWGLLSLAGLVSAQCPYMDASPEIKQRSEVPEDLEARGVQTDADFLEQFVVDDSNAFITSDAGGPIEDNHSLKAGERGPTLLEDFIFRQKIQHFDHERVCRCPKTNQTFRASANPLTAGSRTCCPRPRSR